MPGNKAKSRDLLYRELQDLSLEQESNFKKRPLVDARKPWYVDDYGPMDPSYSNRFFVAKTEETKQSKKGRQRSALKFPY